MAEIRIRQSGKRGSGAFLGIALLALLVAGRWGSRVGQVQNAIDRDQGDRHRAATIRTGKDVENLRRFLQRNNTADEFLKSLPKPAEVPDEPAAVESSEQNDGVEQPHG